jgi:hypothetical protein
MRLDLKSMLLGAAVTVASLVGGGALLFGPGAGAPVEARHRSMKLPSGRAVELMGLHLAFGDEHSQRGAVDDGLVVEYVTAFSIPDERARDEEAEEVFGAIRPLAESLGTGSASLYVFSSPARAGGFESRAYEREAGGAWTSRRAETKMQQDGR